MKIQETGIILYTINYQETVKFYKEIFGLKTLYEKENLTCLKFSDSYLMIEIDDEENILNDKKGRSKFCMRFNVEDVKEACKTLDINNVPYTYNEFEWGTIAKFLDPDGNQVGLRSAIEHESDKNQ